MKRLLLVVAVVGMVLLARRLLARAEGLDWEKMLERMPETAPPKWMFRNITAIRENTDHILERLEAGAARENVKRRLGGSRRPAS